MSSLIGTDATGEYAIGNAYYGVYDNASNNTIGGTTPGEGNIISGNDSYGVIIDSASQVTIQGNLIGTDNAGTGDIGNLRGGVIAGDYASFNTVGGTEPGAGNIIAFNHGNGVTVGNYIFDPSTNNQILSNSIFANTGLAIDLANDGVTSNLPGSYYGVPNDLQSYPVLTSAARTMSGTTIAGTLHSAPDTSFTIQFFSNPAADPTGFGQAENYLGSIVVTTDDYGDASFTFTIEIAVPAGESLSATATDPYGNTSELSQDRTVTSEANASLLPAGSHDRELKKIAGLPSLAAVDRVLATSNSRVLATSNSIDEMVLVELAADLAVTRQRHQ
jgi:hypothetical protein